MKKSVETDQIGNAPSMIVSNHATKAMGRRDVVKLHQYIKKHQYDYSYILAHDSYKNISIGKEIRSSKFSLF